MHVFLPRTLQYLMTSSTDRVNSATNSKTPAVMPKISHPVNFCSLTSKNTMPPNVPIWQAHCILPSTTDCVHGVSANVGYYLAKNRISSSVKLYT